MAVLGGKAGQPSAAHGMQGTARPAAEGNAGIGPPADGKGLRMASKTGTVLGIQDTWFTVNGRRTFLLGISYYAALGAPEDFIRRDLDDLQRHGFNWLRIWATWAAFDNDVSAVDTRGAPREPFLGKLQWLLAECDRRGLVVDVTLTRKKAAADGRRLGGLADFISHQRAVETLINSLKQFQNWYLDLANEHDVGDARYVSPAELKQLRDLVRRLDPKLPVTASYGGHDLAQPDIYESLVTAGLDFLCPHRPRQAGSPSQTEAQTRACLALAKAVHRSVPVHYQEPFRRGYGKWAPTADDFLNDLRGALAGGADGWCFHNGAEQGTPDSQPRRSFDLTTKRLFEQLDAEERKVVDEAKKLVASAAANRSNWSPASLRRPLLAGQLGWQLLRVYGIKEGHVTLGAGECLRLFGCAHD